MLRAAMWAASLVSASWAFGQQTDGEAGEAVRKALVGDWVGYLEYRDYSEPATSTKRVQLPTWLEVTATGKNLALHYVYDDGPTKVVEESEQLGLDSLAGTYTVITTKHSTMVYRAEGFNALRDGHGVLTLSGTGTENDKPSEERVTLTIRRNMVEWLLESRAAGAGEPFAFRHLYRFTRAQAPAVR
jgi:hypothetical protein